MCKNQLFNSICKQWHYKWFLKHLQYVHHISHANGQTLIKDPEYQFVNKSLNEPLQSLNLTILSNLSHTRAWNDWLGPLSQDVSSTQHFPSTVTHQHRLQKVSQSISPIFSDNLSNPTTNLTNLSTILSNLSHSTSHINQPNLRGSHPSLDLCTEHMFRT
jgi:hypothetical protein